MQTLPGNFSDSSIKVIQLAHQITNDLGHSVIGTEHILLGILSNQTSYPSIILKSMGITYKKTEEEVLRLQARSKASESNEYDFTPRAKALFTLVSETIDDPSKVVEPDDLMLGLLQIKRCTAQKIMHALDFDQEIIASRLNRSNQSAITSDTTTDLLSELHKKIRAGSYESDETVEEETPDPMIGYIIDQKYVIESVIGRGGMGVVYKVKHLILDRKFAIKILHPYLASDSKNKRRFQREAQAASRLTHPNLATVFDWDLLEDGRPYLIMYYIEGVKLSDLIGCQEKIPLSTWMSIFTQLCDALDHAHSQGVIHRDLKPGNIILSKEGNVSHFVKIVDFGIAKLLYSSSEVKELTQPGEVFGSPLYMSPEQCLANTIDIRSDIYALGCVMYEVLTSSPPFSAETLYETMKMHVSATPARIAEHSVFKEAIPLELEGLIMKCLNKNPEARPQSMQELKTGLSLVNKHYFKSKEE